jgi:hypothetical protein
MDPVMTDVGGTGFVIRDQGGGLVRGGCPNDQRGGAVALDMIMVYKTVKKLFDFCKNRFGRLEFF